MMNIICIPYMCVPKITQYMTGKGRRLPEAGRPIYEARTIVKTVDKNARVP